MHRIFYRLKNWREELKTLQVHAGSSIACFFGSLSAYGTLALKVKYVGIYIPGVGLKLDHEVNLGVVCSRSVTDAGVAFLCTDWLDNSKDISNFNAHASGTGTTAEAASQTALITEVAARVTGTKSKPTANQLQSVATITYAGAFAITEHGLFDSTTPAGSTLWDRSLFAAINVGIGDSIQFTYVLTANAGG